MTSPELLVIVSQKVIIQTVILGNHINNVLINISVLLSCYPDLFPLTDSPLRTDSQF